MEIWVIIIQFLLMTKEQWTTKKKSLFKIRFGLQLLRLSNQVRWWWPEIDGNSLLWPINEIPEIRARAEKIIKDKCDERYKMRICPRNSKENLLCGNLHSVKDNSIQQSIHIYKSNISIKKTQKSKILSFKNPLWMKMI